MHVLRFVYSVLQSTYFLQKGGGTDSAGRLISAAPPNSHLACRSFGEAGLRNGFSLVYAK